MASCSFVYVMYVRTTIEKLWDALLKPEFTRVYWFGVTQKSEWTPGAAWEIRFPDGTLGDSGEVLEIEKPKRLVIRWRHEFRPDLKAEGYSRCLLELEPADDAVRLIVRHEMDQPESKFIAAVSDGWPKILSSLKSLLETGVPLDKVASLPPLLVRSPNA
jgi:uncharacterized protein YndB with AHSA1/START domain